MMSEDKASGPTIHQRQRASGPSPSTESSRQNDLREGQMLCPVCGTPMPDLKGGKASICAVCGFKDSCCY
jgi:hypothetical protein